MSSWCIEEDLELGVNFSYEDACHALWRNELPATFVSRRLWVEGVMDANEVKFVCAVRDRERNRNLMFVYPHRDKEEDKAAVFTEEDKAAKDWCLVVWSSFCGVRKLMGDPGPAGEPGPPGESYPSDILVRNWTGMLYSVRPVERGLGLYIGPKSAMKVLDRGKYLFVMKWGWVKPAPLVGRSEVQEIDVVYKKSDNGRYVKWDLKEGGFEYYEFDGDNDMDKSDWSQVEIRVYELQRD